MTGELESLNGRLADNARRGAEAQAQVAEQETLAAGYRAQAEETLSGQSELLARSGALSEEITERKARLAALNAQREETCHRAEDLRRLAAELTGDRTQKEQTVLAYQAKIGDARTEIARRQADTEVLDRQGQALRDRLTALNQEKLALEAERTAKARAGQEMNETLLNLERAVSHLEQKQEMNETLLNLERAVSHLEQKLATSSMEEKQILDRLWEHYELSHSDAAAQRIELESTAKAGRRIGELKREINALGTINIGAIEEFERVNGRYTYLSEQRNDVERAREELSGIIEEITGQMTEIFSQQFKLLAESFQDTFTELFGGGMATLELEDENDILGCGIEIKAQPPGKTLKTISLLSGGEKAFVAIALYFSILKVHPTPFCVLDEIEAALDDANVSRYARYMRTLAGKTQFIVITHRRGTMEEADVLYGVTMQEQGVSKILTINMNELAKELKIE